MKRRPNRTEIIQFRCTPEQRKALEAEADRLDLSVSDVIRKALKAALGL